jgi:hypothetical protein
LDDKDGQVNDDGGHYEEEVVSRDGESVTSLLRVPTPVQTDRYLVLPLLFFTVVKISITQSMLTVFKIYNIK